MPDKRKYIILLADDDYLNYVYYSEILESDMFDIIYVDNGKDAVKECINNKNIDLVLMDMKMPYISGEKAIEKIRSFNLDVPVLIQSAYLSKDNESKIKSLPLVDFISKPVREDLLLSKISCMLSIDCKL